MSGLWKVPFYKKYSDTKDETGTSYSIKWLVVKSYEKNVLEAHGSERVPYPQTLYLFVT